MLRNPISINYYVPFSTNFLLNIFSLNCIDYLRSKTALTNIMIKTCPENRPTICNSYTCTCR